MSAYADSATENENSANEDIVFAEGNVNDIAASSDDVDQEEQHATVHANMTMQADLQDPESNYAVLCENGYLVFFYSDDPPLIGDAYETPIGISAISKVYPGANSWMASSGNNDVSSSNYKHRPWYPDRLLIKYVAFANTTTPCNVGAWFEYCSNMLSCDMANLNTSGITSFASLFYGCTNLTTINNMGTLDASQVTTLSLTFNSCKSLVDVDLADLSAPRLTNMFATFDTCEKLPSVDLSNLDTRHVTEFAQTFRQCYKLKELKVDPSIFKTSSAQNLRFMFTDCRVLTSVPFEVDLSTATNIEWMFKNCNALTSVTFIQTTTPALNSMSDAFYGCGKLTSIDATRFDTSRVKDMSYVFYGCTSIQTLNLSGWDTSKVTDFSYMFAYCYNLTSLDLSSFQTSNATTMSWMFYDCFKLQSLNVSSFDTSNVGNMSSMFSNCEQLQTLDISNFDTTLACSTLGSFLQSCSALSTLKVGSKWHNPLTGNSAARFPGDTWYNDVTHEVVATDNTTPVPTDIAGIYVKTLSGLEYRQVIFNANGGSGSMDAAYPASANYTVPANAFSNSPYFFAGWSLSDDNVPTIFPGNTISVGTGQTVLYACWDLIMTFDANGNGTFSNGVTQKLEDIGSVVRTQGFVSKTMSSENYSGSGTTFNGMAFSAPSYSYQAYNRVVSIPGATKLTVTIYANLNDWSDSMCMWGGNKLSYDPLYGAQSPGDYIVRLQGTTTTNTYSGRLAKGTHAGDVYEVLGDTVTFGYYSPSNNNYGYYAVVTADDGYLYEAVYNDSCSGPAGFTPNAGFIGWSDSPNGNLLFTDFVAAHKNGITTVYAICKSEPYYTIAYHNNNSERDYVVKQVLENDEDSNILGDSWFSKSSCFLTRWAGAADGSGASYAKGESIVNLALTGTVLNLYAQWEDYATVDANYAVYCADGTLTFVHCDSAPSVGTEFTSLKGATTIRAAYPAATTWMASTPTVPWSGNMSSLVSVEFRDRTAPISMYRWFYSCSMLTTIEKTSNLDTSNVTNMSYLFYYCRNLENVDLSKFDTSQVTDMSYMFANCGLKTADFSSFDTSQVTTMQYMFYYSSFLSLILPFDTSHLQDMSFMFYGLNNLTTLDISTFNGETVSTMTGTFSYCPALKRLDLSNFHTTNTLKRLEFTFSGCSNMEELLVPNLKTNGIEYMGTMCSRCSSLKTLDLSSFTSGSMWSCSGLFSGCTKLESIDLSSLTGLSSCDNMFANCYALKTINAPLLHVSNKLNNLFYNCSSLETLDTSIISGTQITEANGMFSGCSSLTSLDLSNVNVSKTTTMTNMFLNCSSLQTVDISTWDTSIVLNMQHLFDGCSALQSIDMPTLATSNVLDMSYMFNNCSALSSLNTSGWDTAEARTMQNMFYGCSSLTQLDVSSFNTARCGSMSGFVSGCANLQSLKTGDCLFTGQIQNTSFLPVFPDGNWYDNFTQSAVSLSVNAVIPANIATTYVKSLGDPPAGRQVVFLPNGAQGGHTNSIFIDGSNTVTLPACGFSNSNADFAGWSLSTHGGTIMQPGEMLTVSDARTVVYATWTDDAAMVFDANGGAFASGAVQKTVKFTQFEDATTTTITKISDSGNYLGYSNMFSPAAYGYTDSASHEHNEVVTIPGASKLTVTLYSKLSYSYGKLCMWGGSKPTYTVSLTPTSAGEEGCYVYQSGSTPKNTYTGSMTSSHNGTVYEVVGDTVTFGFLLNNASYGISDTSSACGYYAVVTADNMTQPGDVKNEGFAPPSDVTSSLSFKGWSASPSDDTLITDFAAAYNAGVRTVYAQWGDLDETYAISYHANGGAGIEQSQYVSAGASSCIMLNNFVYPGYVFTGWNTTPTGDGTSYMEQQSICDLAQAGGQVDLYAQWKGSGHCANYAAYCANGTLVFYYSDTPPTQGDEIATESEVTTIQQVFAGENGWLDSLYASASAAPWNSVRSSIQSIEFKDVTNPKYANYWFSLCTQVTGIDLRLFDVTNTLSCNYIFQQCSMLQSIDMSTWSESSLKSAMGMFSSCVALQNINMKFFRANNLVDATGMFNGCSSLALLNLFNFSAESLKISKNMFYGCTSLETVIVSRQNSDWSQHLLNSSGMFTNCSKLVGGLGTTFNSSFVTGERAAADSTQFLGYFTCDCLIKYNANGGNGITNSSLAVQDNSGNYLPVALPNASYTPPQDYRFNGWNTQQDSLGEHYDAGDPFTAVKPVTLYAEWVLANHIVSFDPGDGSGDMDNLEVELDGSGTVPDCTFDSPSSDQYFLYWTTQSDGGGNVYYPGQSIEPSDNMTLYAAWTTLPTPTLFALPQGVYVAWVFICACSVICASALGHGKRKKRLVSQVRSRMI